MFSFSLLKNLGPFLRPDLKWLILGLIVALPLSVVQIGPLPIVKYFIDDVLVGKNQAHLTLYPLAVVGLYTLNLLFRFLHHYCVRRVVVGVNQRVREKLFGHLVDLSVDHFAEKKSGELISRVTIDPWNLDNGIMAIHGLVREPITFLAALGFTLYTNWKLALLVFTIAPALAYLFGRTGKYLKQRITQYQEKNSETISVLQESISGIRVLQLFNLQAYAKSVFSKQLNQMSDLMMKISKMEAIASPSVEWLTSIAIALTLFVGGQSVSKGEMTAGDLIAFFTAFAVMINPIRQFGDINAKLSSASAAMDRIQNFLSWKSSIVQNPGISGAPLPVFQKQLAFEAVGFFYPQSKEHRVLNKISFEIPKGKTIALVGQSGSGKSTLVQLIARLYDPIEGCVSLDGIDIRTMDLKQWRDQIAVVSQDVFLFHDTIYQNILMGRLNATREEVIQAAKQAFALDFIEKLPNGMDTWVGDRGVKLSGGERQRVSIARAFLKNAPILILDEATSNLDQHAEKIVQASLEKLKTGKTSLVIAHRLSTIQDADSVVVLENGNVVQKGKFSELIKQEGQFKRLIELSTFRPAESDPATHGPDSG